MSEFEYEDYLGALESSAQVLSQYHDFVRKAKLQCDDETGELDEVQQANERFTADASRLAESTLLRAATALNGVGLTAVLPRKRRPSARHEILGQDSEILKAKMLVSLHELEEAVEATKARREKIAEERLRLAKEESRQRATAALRRNRRRNVVVGFSICVVLVAFIVVTWLL